VVLAAAVASGCGTANVGDTAATQPYGGTPQVIPGVVEAEHYDEGAPGVAYYDVDEVNHGADYRENTQVDIEERSDASNGYGIGWARAGEWLLYTVDVKESGTYTIEIPVASNGKGGTFHLEVDGRNITGEIDVPDTGAWTNLELIHVEGVELEAGVQQLKLVMDTIGESGATADIDCLRFALAE
jgi:endo-1,4-beta-xylanase